MSSSSSTARISDAISNPLLFILTAFLTHIFLRKGECQRDLRAVSIFRIVQYNLPPMVLHDLAHDRQSEACPFGPDRHIGLCQPMPVFGRQANAVVADLECERSAIGLQGHGNAARRFITLGMARGGAL